MKIYLIGSLRNELVPATAALIRKETSHEVFDDWYAAGPEADDYWKSYEEGRGRSYTEALAGHAARHVFEFDRSHLDSSDGGILLLPAGKSGHLELGYLAGQGKRTYILLDRPDRWDVMYGFATGVFEDVNDLLKALKSE